MNCQYCNKTLADLKSLTKHQKQTKYCLEKQKESKQLKEKDDEINLLKNQLKEKDDEIELLKNQTKIEQNLNFDQIQDIIKEYCK
jgi:predicted RNase H-like nuclease (RuvC/YqgF family)